MEDNYIKKKLPYNLDAEQAVIGSMLLNRDKIIDILDIVQKEDFYNQQYGTLFEIMADLYREGKSVDLVTVSNRLKEKNIPEEAISVQNIAEIINAVPTSIRAKDYADIVADKSMLRKMINLFEDLDKECYLDTDDVDNLLETAEQKIYKLRQERRGREDIIPFSVIMDKVIDRIEAASRTKSRITGIPTGFIDLDNMLTGLHGSELLLVAARPAMGKTAFVLNIAYHVAMRKKIPTAIFSLEMSKEDLGMRMVAMDALVNSQKVQTGQLVDDEWDKIIDTTGSLADAPLFIIDNSAVTVADIRSECRRLKQRENLGLVIIDYLQLMNDTNRRSESRQQFISDVSRSLKLLARELDVPVIALSQLNRAVDSRTDHKPVLADLRESGAIEQDADVVMFIYRDDYYNPDTDKKNIAEIIIAKQRKGATGTVELVWLSDYTKFANKEH